MVLGEFVNVDADANSNGYDFTTGGRCWRLFLAYDFSKTVLTPLKTQVRTQVLNEDWRSTLSRSYPWMEETLGAKAA